MARYTFPQDGLALAVGGAGSNVVSADGAPVTIYANSACTVPADITTTAGAPINGSTLYVAGGRLPEFLGPDGVRVLYVPGAAGVANKLEAKFADQLALVSLTPGPKGDKGDTGAASTVPGPKGDKGDPGSPGAASTIPGPKGDKGDPGADSTVPGPKGDKGDPGADSTVPGPKGDKGDTGAASTVPGPKGDKGDAGTAATIAIGTVTTGAPNTPASATNRGTSTAAIIDLTIPRGADGTSGASGPVGPDDPRNMGWTGSSVPPTKLSDMTSTTHTNATIIGARVPVPVTGTSTRLAIVSGSVPAWGNIRVTLYKGVNKVGHIHFTNAMLTGGATVNIGTLDAPLAHTAGDDIVAAVTVGNSSTGYAMTGLPVNATYTTAFKAAGSPPPMGWSLPLTALGLTTGGSPNYLAPQLPDVLPNLADGASMTNPGYLRFIALLP